VNPATQTNIGKEHDMTTYASFYYYEGPRGYLTPGKRYVVLLDDGENYFEIIDDEGDRIGCLWDNWTRHVEPKQTRYHIQVPGHAFIEHVMDYRMDGDMLYVAGAEFEHYYRMKPGDLVTITEMED
jgi:hypothetical protein